MTLDYLNPATPAGQRFLKMLRQAVTYYENGDPVEDVCHVGDLTEGLQLLLGILDNTVPGWDKPRQ